MAWCVISGVLVAVKVSSNGSEYRALRANIADDSLSVCRLPWELCPAKANIETTKLIITDNPSKSTTLKNSPVVQIIDKRQQ